MAGGLKMLIVGVAAMAFSTAAALADTEIKGGGATFPNPLYQKWIQTYNESHPGVKIDYQSIGSGGGIKGITDKTFQFAGSDAPMTGDQESAAKDKILHIPTVAGPVVMIYKLSGVDKLVLDGATIAGIFNKDITSWDDVKIKALNPNVTLPAKQILVVHRGDGSGTTFIFTSYLSKVSEAWKNGPGNATTVKWPTGAGPKGNDGVASGVNNADGAIGYVEYAYAKNKGLPYATVLNAAGQGVEPGVDSVNAAAATIKDFPADMKVSITNAADPKSYPISGYTYLLVYQDLSYLKNKAQAEELVKFINWAEHDGQAMAGDQGYAKLSGDLQKKVDEEIGTITFDGAPLLKK